MFERLGHFAARRAKVALAVYAVVVILCGGLGWQVFGSLKTEGYDDPSSDSAQVSSIIAANFDGATVAKVYIKVPTNVDKDSNLVLPLIKKMVAEPGVSYIDTYWRQKSSAMVDLSKRVGLATVVAQDPSVDRRELAQRIAMKYAGKQGDLDVQVATSPDDAFGASAPAVVLAVKTPNGIENDRAAAEKLIDRIGKTDGVANVQSYWSIPASLVAEFDKSPQIAESLWTVPTSILRSSDRMSGMVLINGEADNLSAAALAKKIKAEFGGTNSDGLTVYVGGRGAVGAALTDRTKKDVTVAEAFTIPILIVLLIFAFGSLVAAGLPFIVALGSIAGSFAAMWGVSQVAHVSVFATNLVTGFGLGLGIDYALLMVNRFREALRRENSVEAAVVTTVRTAGRTVFVSGLTVAVTLGGLVVFPQYFMKSFAYGGVIVVALAVASSLLALPAVLALTGEKINRWKVIPGDLTPADDGMWRRIALFVMRRATPVFLVTFVGLAALASPALKANFGQIDDRALPATDSAAQAQAFLRDNFSSQANSPLELVVPNFDCSKITGGGSVPTMANYIVYALAGHNSVKDDPLNEFRKHITQISSPVQRYVRDSASGDQFKGPNANNYCTPLPGFYHPFTNWSRISVLTDLPARDKTSSDMVEWIRSNPGNPAGMLVGGAPAVYHDQQAAIAEKMPFLLGWLAGMTLLILFLYTGSILLPIKAVLMNGLSLAATLGVLTLIFGDHGLGWVVGGFTNTGVLDSNTLILVGVVAFGLSMDYEVFLLARIKEEHDRGEDTETAVSLGLQRSGRIITTAALLLAVVFAAFIFSGITSIKLLGFGVAFAILLDATIVRGLLVPSFMKLAGKWNWWAPKPLAAFHARFGLSESETPAPTMHKAR